MSTATSSASTRSTTSIAGVARVDTLEGKLATPTRSQRAATLARDRFALFAEIPVDADPCDRSSPRWRGAGINAKIRTGGVTRRRISAADDVVRFIRAASMRACAFKATAGLHHPLRAEYR